jgi:hypothetical protein
MSTQDLFGLTCDDLGSARAIVEKALALTLDPRHSAYHGGDYYAKQFPNKDEITLQLNNDGEEGGWAEDAYKDYGVLLYVYSRSDGDTYKKALTCPTCGITPLERSLTPPSGLPHTVRFAEGAEEVSCS